MVIRAIKVKLGLDLKSRRKKP